MQTKERRAYYYVKIEDYDNGNIKNVINYKDGVLHGDQIYYYDNGKIETKTPFLNGIKHGVAEMYFDNGEIEKHYFIHDKKVSKKEFQNAN